MLDFRKKLGKNRVVAPQAASLLKILLNYQQ
jgi:hypothetical protein